MLDVGHKIVSFNEADLCTIDEASLLGLRKRDITSVMRDIRTCRSPWTIFYKF